MNGQQVAMLIIILIIIGLGFWVLPAIVGEIIGGGFLVILGLSLLGHLGKELN